MSHIEDKTGYVAATLANGLPIVSVADERLHWFSVGVYVAMGPRFEPLAHTGIGHFIEHMVFQGSKSYPTSESITRAVDRIAGQIVASTSPEYCCIGLAVHRKYWREAIAILADILTNPLFDPDEIEHEKKIVLEERAEYHDSDQRNIAIDQLLYNMLNRSADQDISFVGTADNIADFDREMIVEYWRRLFVARNVVVTLAGAFEFEPTLGAVREHFESLSAGGFADDQSDKDVAPGPRCLFRPYTFSRLSVALAWRAAPFNHPDYPAYAAISEFLGSGTNSKLFTRIREELGMVYDISSSLITWSNCGWFEIDTTVSKTNYIPTLTETLEVVREFAADPPAGEELAVCREKMVCSLEIAHDDPAETASWYARQVLLAGSEKIISLEDELREIEELTADQLARVAVEMFAPANAYAVVVGPVGWLARRRTQRVLNALT